MPNIIATHSSGAVGVTLSNAVLGSSAIGEEIRLQMNSYAHKITANGGFWDAQITLSGNMASVLPVVDVLIGLDVRTIASNGTEVWNGFVNQVNLQTGIGSFSIGPLMSVRNNLSVVFQTQRYNTIPPIGGQRRKLQPLADTESQERYGILGHELSGGTGNTEGAQALQATHLEENKYPRVQQSLNIGSSTSSSVSISLQCLGYVHLLDKFIYDANVSGNTTPAPKILTILQAEPNGLFSSLFAPDSNTLSIPNFSQGATGWTEIKSLVSFGDTNFDRYLFQIGAGRDATYRKIDSTYRYFLQTNGNVHDKAGRVRSWEIEPGYWMSASSLVIGEQQSGDIGTHISDVFIESVSYTAPDNAQIQGGKVDRSIQQLAQRGVGGSF